MAEFGNRLETINLVDGIARVEVDRNPSPSHSFSYLLFDFHCDLHLENERVVS